MIILDTNVISELMRREPHPGVVAWLDSIPRSDIWTTTITIGELAAGIALLPSGARRTRLEHAVQRMLHEFTGRILSFTPGTALRYGAVVGTRARAGRPISIADAQIAATALEASAIIATRNVKDFEGTGVAILDPWLVNER